MNNLGNDIEIAIVEKFRRGETSAMDRLYAAYANYLTGVCSRYIVHDDDLKDVLQESFIKIFTRMNSFDYRGKGSLRAWVTKIAINECLLFLRRQKQNTFVVDMDPPDIPDEEPDTEGLSGDVLTRLIRQLPDGYRTVLNLYVIEGKSHKEIAEMLNIKPDTSASQLHRAKNMLAKFIKDYKRYGYE
ncbi:RNA polymerase sigma factor [Segatella bryantii]|uniref:RNA polymerase sigma factor n=1 Tax=Segatella bryantii TaxID=77095 RepID=UPI0024792D2A|nr:RNA polymerase sigma factor [Segatella bryantii]